MIDAHGGALPAHARGRTRRPRRRPLHRERRPLDRVRAAAARRGRQRAPRAGATASRSRGPEYRRDGPYYNLAEELLDRERPADWNQALMELGATVCRPRNPRARPARFAQHCPALAQGEGRAPARGPGTPRPSRVTVAAALIEKDGRVLLVRRPRYAARSHVGAPADLARVARPAGPRGRDRRAPRPAHRPGRPRLRARHAITFRRITLEGYHARLAGGSQGPGALRWATPARTRLAAGVVDDAQARPRPRTPQLPLPSGGFAAGSSRSPRRRLPGRVRCLAMACLFCEIDAGRARPARYAATSACWPSTTSARRPRRTSSSFPRQHVDEPARPRPRTSAGRRAREDRARRRPRLGLGERGFRLVFNCGDDAGTASTTSTCTSSAAARSAGPRDSRLAETNR